MGKRKQNPSNKSRGFIVPINSVLPHSRFIARLTLSDLAAAHKKVGEYAGTDVIKVLIVNQGIPRKKQGNWIGGGLCTSLLFLEFYCCVIFVFLLVVRVINSSWLPYINRNITTLWLWCAVYPEHNKIFIVLFLFLNFQ